MKETELYYEILYIYLLNTYVRKTTHTHTLFFLNDLL